jgi:hypothetical protein
VVDPSRLVLSDPPLVLPSGASVVLESSELAGDVALLDVGVFDVEPSVASVVASPPTSPPPLHALANNPQNPRIRLRIGEA